MSVLELSLYSYEKIYSKTETVSDHLFYFSLKQRKTILKISILAFILFTAFYIYLAGAIAADNLNKEKLQSILNKVLSEKGTSEQILISQSNNLALSSLLGSGYEEPKDLILIRQQINVAKSQESSIYQ